MDDIREIKAAIAAYRDLMGEHPYAADRALFDVLDRLLAAITKLHDHAGLA